MNHDTPDVVTVLAVILTIVTSKDVAAYLSPYAAIVVAASAGSAVSLSIVVKDMPRWWQPMYYFLSRILIATTFTVAIAGLLHAQWPDIRLREFLVPIAGCLGLVWNYGAVLQWIVRAAKKILPAWLANLGKRDG
mgnify:FL=1